MNDLVSEKTITCNSFTACKNLLYLLNHCFSQSDNNFHKLYAWSSAVDGDTIHQLIW